MNHFKILLYTLLFVSLNVNGNKQLEILGTKLKIPNHFEEVTQNEFNKIISKSPGKQFLNIFASKDSLKFNESLTIYYDSLIGNKDLKFKDIVQIKIELLEKYGFSYSNTFIDSSKHFVTGTLKKQNESELYGFSVNENGMLSIQLSALNQITTNEEFNKIFSSIKHSSPYQYRPKLKDKMDYNGKLVAISLGLILLVWGIRKFIVKK